MPHLSELDVHVLDFENVDEQVRITLRIEDRTCAGLDFAVTYYPGDKQLEAETAAAAFLTANELDQIAAVCVAMADRLRREAG